MEKLFNITNEGLKELRQDSRDFPLGAVFGTTNIKDVPDTDFLVAQPLVMKDQGDTDYCSAFAVTEVSEDQEGVELLPEYQFYSTKRITGDPSAWGADLRDACKSACQYGSVPTVAYKNMQNQPRDFILDEKNWPESADMVARIYKKSSYFTVDGQNDVFDNIRAALFTHKADKCTIVTGALWKRAWIDAPNGIIQDVDGDGFGHAFKLYGQQTMNGELCIVAQLSNGTAIGNGGIFYFNRAVVNKNLGQYGLFMFKDIAPEVALGYINSPYTVNTPFYVKLIDLISNFFKK